MWAYGFVEDRTREGGKFRTLNVVDEFSRECLAIRVGRRLGSTEVPDARASSGIDVLTDLFITRGTPAYIRSDNGPEFIATTVKAWITALGAKPAYIEPGNPWENGYEIILSRTPVPAAPPSPAGSAASLGMTLN